MNDNQLRIDLMNAMFGEHRSLKPIEQKRFNRVIRLIIHREKETDRTARINELDQIIDLQEKQFNRWTQTDIANFFHGVGKRYRDHESRAPIEPDDPSEEFS